MGRNSALVLLMSGIATLLLGWLGFFAQLSAKQTDGVFLDALYRAAQLLVVRSGSDFPNPIWEINVARFAGALIFASSAIYIFFGLFNEKIRQSFLRTRVFFAPLAHRFSLSPSSQPGHIVICGAGFLGTVMACHFRKEGRTVVVLEKDKNKPEVKTCRKNGALVLHQDATTDEVLRSVGVHGAAMVFAVTGDDGRNTDIASACAGIAQCRPLHLPPLACHVHIEDANLSFALRQWELELPAHEQVHVGFFNMYHAAGRSAAACESRKVITASAGTPAQPALLIIGLGDFGKSLLVNLVKRWRETHDRGTGKLRIVVVDRDAEASVLSLFAYYPSLEDYCDIVPQEMDVHSAEFIRGDFLDGTDPEQLTGAYVCLSDEGDSTSVAITLHDLLCKQCGCASTGPGTPPIIVRTVNETGMTEVVRKLRDSLNWNIHPFPILTNFCEEKRYGNELPDLLAEATHNDYCKREFDKGITEEENPSLAPWPRLPEDVKATNRAQAESLIRNIHDYGYRVVPMRSWNEPCLQLEKDDPVVLKLAIREHDRYVKMKLAQGYRWGPENDKVNKINKTLIRWEELSDDEQEKDIQTVLEFPKRLAQVFFRLDLHPSPVTPSPGEDQGSG